MKKTLIHLFLVALSCVVILPSCSKKSGESSNSSSKADSTAQKESVDAVPRTTEPDEDYAKPANNGDGVDRLLHIFEMMGNEIMKHPERADAIGERFEHLGNQIDENTPVSVSDIKKLNEAVVEMLTKAILGAIVADGVDPNDLTQEQEEAIDAKLSEISDQLAYKTASSRTLGEYVWKMAAYMQNLN